MRAFGLCALLAACSASEPGGSTTDASPGDAAASDAASGDALAEARTYNLAQVNAYRAQAKVPLLKLDDALDAFAQAASDELSQDHQSHAYFLGHASGCACGVESENQGDADGIPPAEAHTQIDEILKLMMSGGAGEPHHDNIVDPRWTRLGAGLVGLGARMYFTNDFAP